MCTLTWLHSGTHYTLFFNRDELNTRLPASLPRQLIDRGVRLIAPTDADAGGTWISCNEYGTSLCLLNNYSAATAVSRNDWISRGQLVKDLSVLSADRVIIALKSMSLELYRAFDLVVFGLVRPPLRCSWAHQKLTISEPKQPLTSSSFATERVIGSRIKLFTNTYSKHASEPSALRDFHRSHSPDKGAFSVCMHRPDAQTVSYSEIYVDNTTINFDYIDGPPCSTHDTFKTNLQRSGSHEAIASSRN